MYIHARDALLRLTGPLFIAAALAPLALAGAPPPAYAATIDVNTFADELNSDGDCSLREAIRASNTNAAVDACPPGGSTFDTINLQAGTYTLSVAGQGEDSAATGDLDITTPTPSVGNLVTINGNGATVDGGAIDRVFDMYDASPKASTLNINNLTIRNGNPGATGGGGAIRVGNSDTLSLTNVVVADSSTGLGGGGITNNGSVSLTDVTIRGNQAAGVGGGFQNAAAGANLTANNVTISGNVTTGSGGAGFYNESSATATMTNVTISGNTATVATSAGGGIQNRTGATVTLTNATITGNSAGNTAPGGGGGIRNNGTGTVNVKNTIVAGNSSAQGADCNGTLASQGHNLVQSAGSCSISGGSGDITGQNPLLGALASNGGATQTHALQTGSPAINAGDNTGCPSTDQRGVSRAPWAPCDIGAYEYDGAAPTPSPSPTHPRHPHQRPHRLHRRQRPPPRLRHQARHHRRHHPAKPQRRRLHPHRPARHPVQHPRRRPPPRRRQLPQGRPAHRPPRPRHRWVSSRETWIVAALLLPWTGSRSCATSPACRSPRTSRAPASAWC